jgi:hypothetical protein
MYASKSCNSVIPLMRQKQYHSTEVKQKVAICANGNANMTATVKIMYSEVRISVHRLMKTIKILIRKNDTSHNLILAPPTYQLHFYCYTANFQFWFKHQPSHHTNGRVCITAKYYNILLSAKNANATATPVSSKLKFLYIQFKLWV